MIYFIRRLDGLIKIGYSGFVAVRAQALACEHGTVNVLAVIDGSTQTERILHARFDAHRVTGEWFSPCGELISYIGALVSREPIGIVTRRAPDPIPGGPAAIAQRVQRTTSQGRRLRSSSRQGALARALADLG